MSITLARSGVVLPLDPDLYWADENEYSPVAQAVDRSLTGALIVQVDGDANTPGRPITLQPEDDTSAWMLQQDLAVLNEWAALPGEVFTLTLRGVERQVIFRHNEAPAVSAKPVTHYSDVMPFDPYLVTLKFLEI